MELQWLMLVTLAVLELEGMTQKRGNNLTPADAVGKNIKDIFSLEDLPLTKSLGYTHGKVPRDTLEDTRLKPEYMEQYQDMLIASQESFDTVHGVDKPLRNEGRRQRHAHQEFSPVGRRRARSEALRRDKLNSQSLRSHMEHTRQSSTEQQSKETIEN